MSKDLFKKRHGDALGMDKEVIDAMFDKHDDDSNDMLFRDEYAAAQNTMKEL